MPQRRDGEKMKVRRQCFGTLPDNRVVELSSLCSALIAALLDDYLLAVVDVDASGQVGSGGEALSHHVIVSVVASGCLVAADGGDGCGQLPVHDIRRVAHDGGLALVVGHGHVVVYLDAYAAGEHGVVALVGAVEVDARVAEVVAAAVDLKRNLGHVLGEVVAIGLGKEYKRHIVVGEDAIHQVSGVDVVAVNILGENLEVEAAVAIL